MALPADSSSSTRPRAQSPESISRTKRSLSRRSRSFSSVSARSFSLTVLSMPALASSRISARYSFQLLSARAAGAKCMRWKYFLILRVYACTSSHAFSAWPILRLRRRGSTLGEG